MVEEKLEYAGIFDLIAMGSCHDRLFQGTDSDAEPANLDELERRLREKALKSMQSKTKSSSTPGNSTD